MTVRGAVFTGAPRGRRASRASSATEVDRVRFSRRGAADLALFHEFAPPPTGGGHQFLRALVGELERRGLAVEVNRISARNDAPASSTRSTSTSAGCAASRATTCASSTASTARSATYRGFDDGTDARIAEINRELADATIVQSRYSLDAHRALGIELVDPRLDLEHGRSGRSSIRPAEREPLAGRRVRVIATSWSDNPNKGADVLAWLDRHLDHERYELTFAGRTRRVVRARPRRSARSRRSRSPPSCGAATSTSPRAGTTRARTRCSRRSPAGCRPSSARAAATPSSSARRASPFDEPEEVAAALDRLVAELDERRAAIRVAPLAEVADRYLEVLARMTHARLVARPARSRRARLRRARGRARGRGTRASSPSASAPAGRSTRTPAISRRPRGGSATTSRPRGWARFATDQSVFLTSHFEALQPRWLESTHRLGTAYLHGRPGTPGYPEFDRAFEALRAGTRALRADPGDARRDARPRARGGRRAERGAPHPDRDRPRALPARRRRARAHAARAALGLPADAFVVGSFQKDGVGWGEGLEPKLIKGPDVLVAALERVAADVPELLRASHRPGARLRPPRARAARDPVRHVRGAGSRRARARRTTRSTSTSSPSRQEGGPKAVLESMAAGVPLVTTRVGQAPELVEDGANGSLVDVEDAEALAARGRAPSRRCALAQSLVTAADARRRSATRYERLDPLWAELLDGLRRRGDALTA